MQPSSNQIKFNKQQRANDCRIQFFLRTRGSIDLGAQTLSTLSIPLCYALVLVIFLLSDYIVRFITDQFSGLGSAICPVCTCVRTVRSNNKNSSGNEIANVNFLTMISHTRRPTSKY